MILLFKQLKQGEVRFVAASLAFSTVLSLIPFLALTLSVFQMIGGLEFLVPKIQGLFLRHFREAFGLEVTQFIKLTLMKINPKTLGSGAAIILIFTSFRLLQDMEYGINRMWKANPERPQLKRFGIASALMLLIPLLLAVYAGFRSMDTMKPLFKLYRAWIDGAVGVAGLFTIYKILPEVKVHVMKAFYGALLSGVALIILNKSFAWITKSSFGVSKFYGSLAAIPFFLIYVLIVWYIVLIGAAFVAYLHNRSEDELDLQ